MRNFVPSDFRSSYTVFFIVRSSIPLGTRTVCSIVRAEVGNVTSKRNDVTRYCFCRVLRAITSKSDNVIYEPRAITLRSNNDFQMPRAITIKSDNFSPQG
jgi:hypothetical protein